MPSFTPDPNGNTRDALYAILYLFSDIDRISRVKCRYDVPSIQRFDNFALSDGKKRLQVAHENRL